MISARLTMSVTVIFSNFFSFNSSVKACRINFRERIALRYTFFSAIIAHFLKVHKKAENCWISIFLQYSVGFPKSTEILYLIYYKNARTRHKSATRGLTLTDFLHLWYFRKQPCYPEDISGLCCKSNRFPGQIRIACIGDGIPYRQGISSWPEENDPCPPGLPDPQQIRSITL